MPAPVVDTRLNNRPLQVRLIVTMTVLVKSVKAMTAYADGGTRANWPIISAGTQPDDQDQKPAAGAFIHQGPEEILQQIRGENQVDHLRLIRGRNDKNAKKMLHFSGLYNRLWPASLLPPWPVGFWLYRLNTEPAEMA
jgi:hypothetical protein